MRIRHGYLLQVILHAVLPFPILLLFRDAPLTLNHRTTANPCTTANQATTPNPPITPNQATTHRVRTILNQVTTPSLHTTANPATTANPPIYQERQRFPDQLYVQQAQIFLGQPLFHPPLIF